MPGEPLRCPNDGATLVEAERSDVVVATCPECRGVWLDRGELDKVLVLERRLAGHHDDSVPEVEGGGHASRPHEPPRFEERRDLPPRRRGLLEDLLESD